MWVQCVSLLRMLILSDVGRQSMSYDITMFWKVEVSSNWDGSR